MAKIFGLNIGFKNTDRTAKRNRVQSALNRGFVGDMTSSLANLYGILARDSFWGKTVLRTAQIVSFGVLNTPEDMELARGLANKDRYPEETLTRLSILSLDKNAIPQQMAEAEQAGNNAMIRAKINKAHHLMKNQQTDRDLESKYQEHMTLFNNLLKNVANGADKTSPFAMYLLQDSDLDPTIMLRHLQAEADRAKGHISEAAEVNLDFQAQAAQEPSVTVEQVETPALSKAAPEKQNDPLVVTMDEFKAKLADISAMDVETFEAEVAALELQEEELDNNAPRMSRIYTYHAQIIDMVNEVEQWDIGQGMPANADEKWNIEIVNGFYTNQINLGEIGYLAAEKQYPIEIAEYNAAKEAALSTMPWAEFIENVNRNAAALEEDPNVFYAQIDALREQETAELDNNHYVSRFITSVDEIADALNTIQQSLVNPQASLDPANALTNTLVNSFQSNVVDVIKVVQLAEEAFELEMALNPEYNAESVLDEEVPAVETPVEEVELTQEQVDAIVASLSQEQINDYLYKDAEQQWFEMVEETELKAALKHAEENSWNHKSFEETLKWVNKYKTVDAHEAHFSRIDTAGNEDLTSFALHAKRLADTWNTVQSYQNEDDIIADFDSFDDLAVEMIRGRHTNNYDWKKMAAIAGDLKYQEVLETLPPVQAMTKQADEMVSKPITQHSSTPNYGASTSTNGKQVKYNYL
jgi:hypothetical protein